MGSEKIDPNNNFIATDYVKMRRESYGNMIKIFPDVELKYNLLARVRQDAGFQSQNRNVRYLIENEYGKCAQFLMIHAEAANLSEKEKYKKIFLEQKEIVSYYEKYQTYNNYVRLEDIINRDLAYNKKLIDDWNKFCSVFLNTVSGLNLYRLSYAFSRMSWKLFLLYIQVYLQDSILFINNYLNISILDESAYSFYLLSVLIFVSLLVVDTLEIIKHVFAPTSKEKEVNALQRLEFEWSMRYTRMVNAIWWGIFNAITNFPSFFGIAPAVANWILVGCLFFDVFFLAFILNKKIIQLTAKISELKTQDGTNVLDDDHITMHKLMMDQAELSLLETKAQFGMYIAATLLFILSLTLVLSITSPIIGPIGFFTCVLAVAFILSGENFSKYIVARKLSMESIEDNELHEKANNALWNFGMSLAENIFMPLLIVGLFTINLPAAFLVTVLYVASKNIPANDTKQIPANEDNNIEYDIPIWLYDEDRNSYNAAIDQNI